MSPPQRMNEAERRLWEAYPAGALVVLGDDRPDEPVAGRTVRAQVLSRLLLGAREADPGRVPAVRLRGAYVTGLLDISGGSVGCELRLERCRLEQAPDFSNAQTRQVRMSDCRMPGFDGGGLRAEGYLSLSGSLVEGPVRLPRALVTGGLRMNGTKVTTAPGTWAFFSGGLVVEVGAFMRRAEFTGGVRLVGARMNGGLFMEGAKLSNPGGDALDAQNIVVTDAMECSQGFVAEGRVRLRSARVDGVLSFHSAVLRASGDERALHLSHAQVQELILIPAEPIDGVVSLVYSTVGVLFDRGPELWPARLRLNGLVYESLRSGGVAERIGWVGRDPSGFRPQPYEQLAAWYLRDGNEHLARKAQLAKLRARRRTLRPAGRIWGGLLDVTVGYGYRPWLAAMWFALLLAAGTASFGAEPPRPLKQPAELPDFNPFIYTLDLLIPIGTFGRRELYDPAGWSEWLAYGLIVSGWILATALVAGATRVLRPN